MGFKFNPFTGNFDQTGSGGGGSSYIDGEVQNFSALPQTVGSPAVDSAYLVREAEGTWLLNRKPAGIYIRTANTGVRASDWTYAGEFPDVFNDANFVLYDNGDSTKNLQFQLSGIDTATTRTLTAPNASGTIQLTGHAAAHASAGSDPLAPSDIGAADASHTHSAYNDIQNAILEDPSTAFSDLVSALSTDPLDPSGSVSGVLGAGQGVLYAVSDFAPASHTHAAADITSGSFGNISFDGKLGSTAGLPLVTTTAGAVTTLALGTAGQVLTVNSGATGVEFAAASGGGVTGAAASASDVLGVSGSDITGVDATADRIVFWDDSASALKYLEAGSGLSISGTTLTATGGGSGGTKTYAVFSAEHNQPPSTAFATLDTRNSIAVLDFDDATDESAVFVSIMPEGASLGSGLKIRLHWMATTATSGDVVWDVSLERMTTDLDTDSFDTIASGTAAASGTSGILTVTEITLTTIDSVTAGDGYRLKVTRDANNASDTMTGDAELVVCEVRSAA